ncbi:MAG TPA: Plug domain-containing protein, partial [Burkholderiaceae bacterium]|nr:Plug domain-containing protein [Burkholderiaceae bacterium]
MNHQDIFHLLLFCDSKNTLIDTQQGECFHSGFKIFFLKKLILICRPKGDDLRKSLTNKNQVNNIRPKEHCMSFKKKLLPLALAQVIAGGAFSVMSIAPVMAQTADNQPVQRVEITGSNIRRADAETPSPVQVISSDDLKKSGYTTVAQVLQNITANGAGTLSTGFSGAFAGGASGISLRG